MPSHKPTDPLTVCAIAFAITVIAMIILYGCAAPRKLDCHDELHYRPGGMYLQEVCK